MASSKKKAPAARRFKVAVPERRMTIAFDTTRPGGKGESRQSVA